MNLVVSVSILIFCSVATVSSLFCYWNTGCPYKYYSNLTPYNFVRGDIRDSVIKLTGCEPISIWGLIRHGKRSPKLQFAKNIREALAIRDDIISSYNKGNSLLCAQDVENLRNWVDKEKILDTEQLKVTSEGYEEAFGISSRLQQAFPELLAHLDEKDYVIRHTYGKWLLDSAKAFVESFKDKPLKIQPLKDGSDLLAPYRNCQKYLKAVENITQFEVNKYLNSSEYVAFKNGIQKRLGIDNTLNDSNITALSDLCSYFSSGVDNKFSPWCALFTTEDLKVVEYIADLKQYYISGYGLPMNKLFGQVTLADLLKSFRLAKSGNGKKLTSYYVHGTMVNMAYTALKLFKDDTLLTGIQRNANLKRKNSGITSFSSNLMAVLNRCQKEGDDDYNVVFYLNEEPLLSICKEGVCSWQEFEKKISPFLETKIDFCDS